MMLTGLWKLLDNAAIRGIHWGQISYEWNILSAGYRITSYPL